MTRDEIAAVVRKLPLSYLCNSYLYTPLLGTPEYRRAMRQEKARILNSEKQCTRVCAWLQQFDKRPARWVGDHFFRHVAVEAIGSHLSCSAVVVAAIHCGLPYQLVPFGRVVALGVPNGCLRASSIDPERVGSPVEAPW
jgi:hypothetical protein